MRLARFGIGKGFASLFSLSAHNRNVQILEALANLQVLEGETPGFTLSDNNAFLTVRRNPTAEAATTGIAIRCEITDTTDDDTFDAELLDGDDAGDEITVTRPPLLKASIASASYDGNTVTFTYSDTQTRTAAASGYVTHTQRVLPAYATGSIIYALATSDGGYIDLNVDAREWQAVPYIPVP